MSDITRALASIRRIDDIRPIEGADRIVLAIIGGWQLITQKENYVPGDLCVFYEVDSFIPVEEKYEFLRKACFKSTKNLGDGFRIKTMKMKGELSQGLSLPIKEVFKDYVQHVVDHPETGMPVPRYVRPDGMESPIIEEGADVTEFLGVQKYEKPIPAQLMGKIRGNFPSYISKTDQERVQNLTNHLERHADERFEVSLKLDGSSCTVYKNDEGQIGVCSRNLDLKPPEEGETPNLFWATAEASGLIDFVKSFDGPIAVQGELMGPGVQGNRETLQGHQIFIFDLYNISERRYYRPDERIDIFMGRPERYQHCPIIYHNLTLRNLLQGATVIEDILKLANRPSLNHPIAEGIVFKSLDSDFTFKAINNEFLLKEKD